MIHSFSTLFSQALYHWTEYLLNKRYLHCQDALLVCFLYLAKIPMNNLQVVDAPEILTVIGKIPHLSEFLNSLYGCQYKSFFSAFCKWINCCLLNSTPKITQFDVLLVYFAHAHGLVRLASSHIWTVLTKFISWNCC